jgi:hypothetical protein
MCNKGLVLNTDHNVGEAVIVIATKCDELGRVTAPPESSTVVGSSARRARLVAESSLAATWTNTGSKNAGCERVSECECER